MSMLTVVLLLMTSPSPLEDVAHRAPLPAAPVSRGTIRLLCREGPQRAGADVCLFRGRCIQRALEMQDDCACRDLRPGHASIACILRDPLACYTHALVSPRFVLADGHGEPTASGADKRIAHEALDRHYVVFHFCLLVLKKIEKLLCAASRIVSHDCMHEILPNVHKMNVRSGPFDYIKARRYCL